MEERQIENLIEQAETQRRLANYQGAIDLLRRALSLDPDHPRAHASLAFVLLAAKRLHGAEIEARAALAADGNDPTSHYAMASVLCAQRKLGDALEHWFVAAEGDTHDVDVYVLGARIRELRNELDEARELLQHGLELEPQDVGALTRLAYLDLNAGKLDEAARHADEALASEPDDADAHVVAGYVALRTGDLEGAEGHARFALNHDSNDFDALHLWAAIKARRSWTLGLWWRLNMWVSLRSETGQVTMLIGSFVVMRLAIIFAQHFELPTLARVLTYGWLGFCAYTWVAPALFQKMLAKDLGKVILDPDY